MGDLIQGCGRQADQWQHWANSGEPTLFGGVRAPLTRGGKVVGEAIAGLVLDAAHGTARVTWELPGGAGAGTLSLVAMPGLNGGWHWRWCCGATGRRVASLYLPHGATEFLSRWAHGLRYKSGCMSARDRAAVRAAKLRQRLGECPPTLGAPLPDPPLAMRASRYLRVCAAIRAAEAEAGLSP